VLYTADGTVNPARGARGGLAGGLSESFKRGRDGKLTRLPACGGVEMVAGETVVSISSGGGGYGSPLERDPARVKHDLDEGWISPARAREIYGLVLATDGSVDQTATSKQRAGLSSRAPGS